MKFHGVCARVVVGILVGVAVLFLAGCTGTRVSPPPDTAGPEGVLRVYLDALVRGDCSAGKILGTTTFTLGNGELCGHTTVSNFAIARHSSEPHPTYVVIATTLTTTGTSDGSIEPGSMTWFYSLEVQSSGSWRIVGGGSGP